MTEIRQFDTATCERIKALCAEGDKLAAARELDERREEKMVMLGPVPG